MEQDNYVVCVNTGEYDGLLVLGDKYYVEESFNLETEMSYKDPEITKEILAKYPNPFFYLKGFDNVCSCCGDRVYFWSGLFQTKQQYENANMEKKQEIARS